MPACVYDGDKNGDRPYPMSVPDTRLSNNSQVTVTVACASSYFDGRTSTCMKLSCALTLFTRICVPVAGTCTLPSGFAGFQ